MKNKILFLSTFAVLLLFSSCAPRLSYFTDDLNDEFGWSETELQRIQFYLSEDIILRRAMGGDESTIQNGKIKVIDGREVEEVIFKKGTPGICLFSPKRDRLAVSFDDDGSENYLMFGPNSKASGRYVLLAKEWKKYKGKVSYMGRTYDTSSKSAFASLMVNLNKAKKISYKKKTAQGRKVNS